MSAKSGAPRTIGAVVMGCGEMGIAQSWAMSRVPGVRLVGFQSASAENAERFVRRFGGEAFVEPKRALEREDVDVVLVTGANHLHAPLTIAALEAGKHVLCQKPMALNLAECDAMIAAADKAGKKLMVSFFEFFHPAFVRAKQLVDDGVIGRVFLMKAIMAWDTPAARLRADSWGFDPARSGGGVMFHVSAHHLALLNWLVQEPVVSVYTEKDALVTGLSVEDTAITIVRTPHAIAEITNCGQIKEPCSQMGRSFKESIEIFGTEGTIHIKPEERPSLRVFTTQGQLFRAD